MKSKTLPNAKNLQREVITKAGETKHLIMGYLFLAIVFMGAVSSVYYWENKTKYSSAAATQVGERQVESGEQVPAAVQGQTCKLEVVTAQHKKTGELRDFPSPCHINEYWEKVN